MRAGRGAKDGTCCAAVSSAGMRTLYGSGTTNSSAASSSTTAVTRTRAPLSRRRASQTRSSRQIGRAMNQVISTANITSPSTLKKKW